MKNKNITILVVSIFLLCLLIFASVTIGSFSLSLNEILSFLAGNFADTLEARVFFGLRLPRTFMVLLTGFALGISGAIYQTVFRNPLASPDITGVASGASLGAGVAIVFQYTSPSSIMFFSFAFGMLSLIALFFLTSLAGMEKVSNFLFSGIIIRFLADAGLMILKTVADPNSQLAAIEYWIMGTAANVTSEKMLLPALGICVSLIILLPLYKRINLLNLGDENATAVGLDPVKHRIILLSVTTFMISCAVSVVGSVAFVGLTAPHIALLITKFRGFFHLFLSMIVGGFITLFADILARTVSEGSELPLSIPIIIISVPVLIFLVLKSRE